MGLPQESYLTCVVWLVCYRNFIIILDNERISVYRFILANWLWRLLYFFFELTVCEVQRIWLVFEHFLTL